MKTSLKRFSCLFVFLFFSFSLSSENKKSMSMIGYWLTSQSIVQVKECDQSLCAIIEVIFVGDGTCLLYTSPSPRDQRGSRMPSSA